MAVKSKTQVQALFTAMVDLLEDSEIWLDGTFMTEVEAIYDAIAAGDQQEEDAAQISALAAVIAGGEALYGKIVALFRTLHPTVGRYAGSANLKDRAVNWNALHEKLIGDSESVKSRGLTKFTSWSAGGSNVGDGAFVVFNTDIDATALDISHIETITLLCTAQGTESGIASDGGQFAVNGEDAGERDWSEGGSGKGMANAYRRAHGAGVNDWHAKVKTLGVGKTLNSVGGSASSGNLNRNADWEGTVQASNVAQWDIESGGSNLSADTTTPWKGTQSLKATGDFVISQSLEGRAGIRTGQAYRLDAPGWIHANVSGADVTIKVKDDDTDHATITQDFTSLTDATWTDLTGVSFVLPDAIGENLRVEIELSNYTGSDHILIGDTILQEMTLVDEGRAVAIRTGQTNWRKGDTATGATTSTDAGEKQKALNRHESRWLEHASSAVGGW